MSRNNSGQKRANSERVVYQQGEEELVALQLNRLAREQLKHRILADIQADIITCRLEGWDYKEYLYELRDLINHFIRSE